MSSEIIKRLYELRDDEYKAFHSALMPTVDPDRIIGVRVPGLRALAKKLIREGSAQEFISELPHYYYEENNLHAFILAEENNFDILIKKTEEFLPFIDNWATCDSFRPTAFARNKSALLPYVMNWLESDREYIVRFGIEVLMTCFLKEDFSDEYPDKVAGIISDKYYVNMMIAWYFATALSIHYDRIVLYLEEKRLPAWVHNKTITKACESLMISSEKKKYLRTLKIKAIKKGE